MPEQVPPGRAGRTWLEARITAVRRGTELLDRKRRLVRREMQRLVAQRDEAAVVLRATAMEAVTWNRRVLALSGATALSRAAAPVAGRSDVALPWRNLMGVELPDTPTFVPALLTPAQVAAANVATGPAAVAARAALEAAVMFAALDWACQRLDQELRETDRRLRAIERRRLPRLEEELRSLDLHLEELEREEQVVTRWAAERTAGITRGANGSHRGSTHPERAEGL